MGHQERPNWQSDHRKVRLLEWLTTPPTAREPRTLEALADELSVTDRTLREWRGMADFREAWNARAQEIVRSPERAQRVLDELYKAALDPKNRQQVQAAKLYLEATDAIKPKPIEVKVTKPVDLSDEELDALLAQGAAELRSEREPNG